MNARTSSILLVAAAVLAAFTAFNVLVGATVRGARIDLTQGRLYTLSPAARPLLARLSEPIRLDLYYTQETGRAVPAVATYAQRVREFLEELVGASGGRITLRVIDPLPYSEAEDEAVAAGLAAIAVDGAGGTLTLGLVATNSVDQRQVIPLLDPSKEPFLEYDILRLIESLGRVRKAKVGLLSTLAISGGFDPANPGRPSPPWQIVQQLRELFEVVEVRPDAEALPEPLDALILVQPRGLAPALLRSIDAYALGGGRILAFLDPFCESQPQDPQRMGLGEERAFDLGPLPAAWGIEIPTSRVVGDRTFALRVQTGGRAGGRGGSQMGPQVVDYVVWLGVDRRGLERNDPITGSLERVNLVAVGAIGGAPGATSRIEPLIHSSSDSMMIETAMISFMPDPARLLTQFRSDDVRRVLAARIEGTIRSAFEWEAAPERSEAGDAASVEPPPVRRAGAPAAIIVVADADLLADQNWIVEERLGPISLGARTIADNGAFVLNALEMLVGDDSMLALRGRGSASRPFERVEAIRKAAEARYLAREQELQQQIADARARIDELQRAKPAEGRGQLILSPEQSKELDRLEQDILEARRELRQVRFNLRADVEDLGNRLMVVNVVAWPLMVALAAMAWTLHRARRSGRRGPRTGKESS